MVADSFRRTRAHSCSYPSVQVRARARLCGGQSDRTPVQGDFLCEQESKGATKGKEEGAGERGAGGAIQAGHGGGLSRRLPERRGMGLYRGNVALGGRPMKTLKRIAAVAALIVIALLIGYCIYTGGQVGA